MIKILIGEAFLELAVDSKKLTAGLSNTEKQIVSFTNNMSTKLKSIGTIMTVAGGAITGALALIVKQTADIGDQFNDMSLRTGATVEDLSTLAYAAKQSGTDIGALELGLKFLTAEMNKAKDGNKEAIQTFADLGVSIYDAKGNLRPVVEVMKDVATAISEMKNPAEQTGTAMKLFGARSGTELIPLLKEGEKGINALQQTAKDLNMEISTKSAQAADLFKDKMTDLTGSLAAAGRTIAEVLIPAITPLIKQATEIVGKISLWAEENPKLVEGLVKAAAILGVIGAVGGPILLAASAFIKISSAMSLLGTLTTGPIGLLILAVGGVYLAWKNWDKIVEYLGGFVSKVKGVFGGMIDFLGGIGEKIANIVASIGAKIKVLLEKIGILKKDTEEIGTVTPKGAIKPATTVLPYAGPIPSLQTGGIIPKTGLYQLHQWEKVTPANQNTYDQRQSFSPVISISIAGDADERKIKRVVDLALEESARQFRRSGFELVPGRG